MLVEVHNRKEVKAKYTRNYHIQMKMENKELEGNVLEEIVIVDREEVAILVVAVAMMLQVEEVVRVL